VKEFWKGKPPAQLKPNNQLRTLPAVNLPSLAVDASGNPWIACRYYTDRFWQIWRPAL
jgi:hypothetical protein